MYERREEDEDIPGMSETSEYWYVQSISTGYPKSII